MIEDPTTRTFWTTALVRAGDLREKDIAKIGDRWRWIYGVDRELGVDRDTYLDDHNLLDTFTVIRHAMDELSRDGITYEDTLIHLPSVDLVEIQVKEMS